MKKGHVHYVSNILKLYVNAVRKPSHKKVSKCS